MGVDSRMVSSRMQSLGCPGVSLGDGADPLRREPGREEPQCSHHSTTILTKRVSYLTLHSGLAVQGLQFDNYSWYIAPQENENVLREMLHTKYLHTISPLYWAASHILRDAETEVCRS